MQIFPLQLFYLFELLVFLHNIITVSFNYFRYPNKYHGLTLPKKLPPRLDPVNVTNLPILGYLEQSLAEITVKSLTAVGSFKPKHPFLDAHQSAHIYMAYFLKGMCINSTVCYHGWWLKLSLFSGCITRVITYPCNF